MYASPAGPVMVLGSGLIGTAVRDRLVALGQAVVTVSRGGPGGLDRHSYDLSSRTGRAALRKDLAALRPRRVVLAHGPSDVTLIERDESAGATHLRVAEVVAECGTPVILISTDNVFSGNRGRYQPDEPVAPCNAYGRVKAGAEEVLLGGDSALVLRVSMVYGWAGPLHRNTFAERCLTAAATARPQRAPTDQSFTPIHVLDVATVTGALCMTHRPARGVRHLAGPQELSRYDFARLAYAVAGADPSLVEPCSRADTEWASRPRFSSLACSDFTDFDGLKRWCPMGPLDGLRAMLTGPPPGRAESR
jgi:dTDP-4-dehydrorhamnose reductase